MHLARGINEWLFRQWSLTSWQESAKKELNFNNTFREVFLDGGNKFMSVQKPSESNSILEVTRVKLGLTRVELSSVCEAIAVTDVGQYTRVSMDAIRKLELGITRPRRKTAQTLAKALQLPIEALFPNGIDNVTRNPEGITRISPDRPKRSMARPVRLGRKLRTLLQEANIPFEIPKGYAIGLPSDSDRRISFAPDIAIPELKLAIEIDYANVNLVSNRDKHRYLTYMNEQGWRVLLVNMDEIDKQPESVIIRILNTLLHIIVET